MKTCFNHLTEPTSLESTPFLEKDEQIVEGKPPHTSKLMYRSQRYMYKIKSFN